MAQEITMTAGARLSMLIRPKEDGVVVPIPVGSTCSAAMQSRSGEIIDLEPQIVDDEIRIDYDTIALSPGRYQMDIRITVQEGYDQWSERVTVVLTKGISPPSAR